jgi:hypothetical protein
MTDSDLERFVASALHGPGDDEEYGETEDADEYEADDGEATVDDSSDEWNDLTAREAWDSLDVEDQQAIAEDPALADQWRRALAGQDWQDEPEDEATYAVASGPDVVKLVLNANPAEFEADTGITQEEWLVWASTCSAAEWAAQAGLVGWPVGSRPSRNDLPVEYRWADEMDRRAELIAAGDKRGYFE